MSRSSIPRSDASCDRARCARTVYLVAFCVALLGCSDATQEGVPPADRVVTGGFPLAVLLGDPSGLVWLVDLESRAIRRVVGVEADLSLPFDLLPQ